MVPPVASHASGRMSGPAYGNVSQGDGCNTPIRDFVKSGQRYVQVNQDEALMDTVLLPGQAIYP